MLEFFYHYPDAGAAGCKILNPDGTLQLGCRRSFPKPLVALPKIIGLSRLFPKSRLFARYNLTFLDPDKLVQVDAISGSFLMFRRQVWEQIGDLDEDFFMYGEDLDYCYRIQQNGWKIYYVPWTKIVHYKGESTKLASYNSFIAFYRSMDIFVKKHFSKSYSFVLDIIFRFGIISRGLISLCGRLIRRHIVLLVDACAITLALLIAHRLQPRPLPPYSTLFYMLMFYLLIWLGTGYAIGLYERRELSYSRAVVAALASFVVSVFLHFIFKSFIYSPHLIFWSFLIMLLFLPGWRIFLMYLQRKRLITPSSLLSKALLSRRTILLGADREGKRIAKKLQTQIEHGFEILGFVDKEFIPERIAGFPFLGVIDDLAELIRINQATEIIFTTDCFSNDEIFNILDSIKDTRVNVKIVPKNLNYILGKSSVDKIEDIPLIEVDYNLFHFGNRFGKRLFDIFTAALILLVASPVIFPYAYIRRCHLYCRKYLGREGSDFSGWIFESRNHKRINPKLEVYPLLFSVLKGDMSIVGSELLSANPNDRRLRCKPGLTGLFQLQENHLPNEVDKQNYEYYYMQNHSFFLDIEIILKALLNI
jgi:lipopolysaccharide/colanic/teichoic acid biosynthesis glycosyltransferase